MWKLVLQYKGRTFLLTLVLLTFGFIGSPSVAWGKGKLVDKGYIVFRVASKLYDLSTVKNTYQKLLSFSCLYPASLLVQFLDLKSEDKWLLNSKRLKAPLEVNEKKTLDKMVKVYKLFFYIKTQQVYMEPSLGQLLKQSAKMNNCQDHQLFKKNDMTESLSLMAKLEVLFNKRKHRLSRFNEEKLHQSIQFIYSTIDKQISHRYLWP